MSRSCRCVLSNHPLSPVVSCLALQLCGMSISTYSSGYYMHGEHLSAFRPPKVCLSLSLVHIGKQHDLNQIASNGQQNLMLAWIMSFTSSAIFLSNVLHCGFDLAFCSVKVQTTTVDIEPQLPTPVHCPADICFDSQISYNSVGDGFECRPQPQQPS